MYQKQKNKSLFQDYSYITVVIFVFVCLLVQRLKKPRKNIIVSICMLIALCSVEQLILLGLP
jgi:hypothetical protein